MPNFDPFQCNFDFYGFTGHLSTHVIPFSFKFDFTILFYYSFNLFKISLIAFISSIEFFDYFTDSFFKFCMGMDHLKSHFEVFFPFDDVA